MTEETAEYEGKVQAMLPLDRSLLKSKIAREFIFSDSKDFDRFSREEEGYGSSRKVKVPNRYELFSRFFQDGARENLEVEALENLLTGTITIKDYDRKKEISYKSVINSLLKDVDRYERDITEEKTKEDKENNKKYERRIKEVKAEIEEVKRGVPLGVTDLGNKLTNLLIWHPITNPASLRYIQEGVKELAESDELRKRLSNAPQILNPFNIKRFEENHNGYDKVKSFGMYLDFINKSLNTLDGVESDCLKDLAKSVRRGLECEGFPKAVKLAQQKEYTLKVEGGIQRKDSYGRDTIVHQIGCILDGEELPTHTMVQDTPFERHEFGGVFQVYHDLIWPSIIDALGEKGLESLEDIASSGAVFGYLNGLASLASLYKRNGIRYTFPQIRDGEINEIFFRNAIHPLLLNKNPVLNDVDLNTNPSLCLIAGANNGGKTTYAKMTGLLTIMSQLGAPIPAEEARITPIKDIYTHFPKTESVTNGKGRFVDELERLKSILEKADRRSLVLLDEPCAGTSNEDAYKVSLDLIKGLQAIGCLTVYTTHIHPLQPEISRNGDYSQCRNLYVETLGTDDNPKFTHRIREGIAGKSYGESYARMILPVEKILGERGIKMNGKRK